MAAENEVNPVIHIHREGFLMWTFDAYLPSTNGIGTGWHGWAFTRRGAERKIRRAIRDGIRLLP